ncbi:copper resistance CopC family protein [Domibacillus robiginosus]|uniref:copper resistance CopC family protein n=1 Tax=Domibacillus robiginosus TaxID=1071054 RepID=UPI000B014D4E|nr:copper resistance CopC family protein [Domibacillus robiginosus]
MKKLFVFLFGLLFLFSSTVSAHTGLESSSPADGDTITDSIQDLSLTFETPIEQESTFTLQNDAGEVALENVQVNNNVLSGSAAVPLENGSYTVNWRIVGEDGHLIEGTYGFTVAAEQTEEPAQEAAPEEADEEITTDQANEQPAADVQEEESTSFSMPIVIGIIVVVALLAIILLMRKGKK